MGKVIIDNVYKGRRYVVIQIEGNPYFSSYCNGYVELHEDEILKDYNNYDIKSDEITFHGELCELKGFDPKNMFFIGFDSAHFWNDENPESKTPEYVEKTCKKIIDEVLKWMKN